MIISNNIIKCTGFIQTTPFKDKALMLLQNRPNNPFYNMSTEI